MKHQSIFRSTFRAWIGALLLLTGAQPLFSQDQEKFRVRLRADIVRVMDQSSHLNIKATARIEGQTQAVAGIELEVYNEVDDEEIVLGNTTTNMNGECRFILNEAMNIKADSTNTYHLGVSFKGNEKFRRASRITSFKDARIIAEHIVRDSVNYITAVLKETATDSVLEGESLDVLIQRLFRPLRIGEEFNFTDENGTILVPIPAGIPGIDGKLTFEVVLNDSDSYGTLKDVVVASVGTPIEFETAFDERNMWSTRGKTPLFLLFFVNAMILVIWGYFVYLVYNLFRISKN